MAKIHYSLLFIYTVIANLFLTIYSYNILALLPLPIKSHYIIFDSVLTELVRRGHNLTVVNTFPKSRHTPNFTDIDVSSCFSFPVELMTMDEAYKLGSPHRQIKLMLDYEVLYNKAFPCPPMSKFMDSTTSTSFDLVITEIFNGDVMLAYANKFHAPVISFCAGMIYPWVADRMGNPFNPSYTSYTHTNVPLIGDMSFYRRFYNTVVYLYASFWYYYGTYTAHDIMARKYVDSNLPSMSALSKKTSLVLAYSHFSLNQPMPMVPNIVEIAGIHIKDPKPLPDDMEKFINESKDGLVYFCLGSLLRIDTLPAEKLSAFLYAFSKLPQRVLWKWNADEFPEKINNVYFSKWMPQRDILAHPKIKLFITHGGALGVNEAVHEGVPILGIPMFGDQTSLLKAIEWYGAGEIIDYSQINNETLLTKLQLLLNDKKYSENMKKLSAIYKDRPMSPMETAIFWIEYVVKHKGAPNLRSQAANLPLYQYLLLDVIAYLLLILLIILYSVYYVVKLIIAVICKSKAKCIDAKNGKKYK